MSDEVIRVENVSKRYLLVHEAAQGGFRYKRFSDVLINAAKAPFRALQSSNDSNPTREEFWALRDVSFEVKRGEVLGVIGSNGAGKSTLLKILSRITDPTSGCIEIEGRVASLLEVGTGFHPELTGRENVYLNGAILGMTRAEIKKRFDEIVAFAEVEKFLDTPVRFYSSGMYVRLAFAVAAHLEPEILIVDEVLAVGDVEFQKKCLGKMREVAHDLGRTVFFVSHNMAAIHQLCTRVLLLNKGVLIASGSPLEVIDIYLHAAVETGFKGGKSYDDSICITDARMLDPKGQVTKSFTHRDAINLHLDCVLARKVPGANIGVVLKDAKDRVVFRSEQDFPSPLSQDAYPLNATCKATIPGNFLIPGRYLLTLFVHIPVVRMIFLAEDALMVNVIDAGSHMAMYEGKADCGCVSVDCHWQISFHERELSV